MNPPPLLPSYVGVIGLIVLVPACIWAVIWLRQRQVVRTWDRMAEWMGGSMERRAIASNERGGKTLKMRAKGRIREYAAFLTEGISYEDAVPYYHTRGALNIRNPAMAVLGLRHKSMLEEVVTRRDQRPVETGHADFDRAFFLLLTAPEHVQAILPGETRKALLRHGDVEIYAKSTQIEWRRAGTMRSEHEMKRLFDVIADMADALGALPARELTLTQKLADEALIEKGI